MTDLTYEPGDPVEIEFFQVGPGLAGLERKWVPARVISASPNAVGVEYADGRRQMIERGPQIRPRWTTP